MWSKRFLEWTDEKTKQSFLSVVFTWDLPKAYQRAVWLRQLGYHVSAGGPAVNLMPDYLADVSIVNSHEIPALERHNSMATRTSEGCPRACPFCIQSYIGKGLIELSGWPIRPIVCDDNLLACSRKHFDQVIDRLKPLSGIDFNQGLDARLLTSYHAGRLAELDCLVRLAFDSVAYESQFMRAFETLRRASIPKKRIRVYVLVGFNDTPEDALYRLRMVADLGIDPNPMRYNPLDTLRRDSYVDPSWTASELIRYVRYWANLRYFRAVPFEEFQKKRIEKDARQLTFT